MRPWMRLALLSACHKGWLLFLLISKGLSGLSIRDLEILSGDLGSMAIPFITGLPTTEGLPPPSWMRRPAHAPVMPQPMDLFFQLQELLCLIALIQLPSMIELERVCLLNTHNVPAPTKHGENMRSTLGGSRSLLKLSWTIIILV